jgi:hypothetical protein
MPNTGLTAALGMMKTMRWIGFALCPLLFVLAPSVNAFAAGGYSNARDLQPDCQAALKFARMKATVPEMYASGYCYGFLSGVADTLVLSEKLSEIDRVTPEDLANVVLRYFDEHPEVLRLSAATAVRLAFRQSYAKVR